MSPLEEVASCHWCENAIKRFQGVWFDSFGAEFCRYHPTSYNFRTSGSTGLLAHHQSNLEIYDLMTTKTVMESVVSRKIDDNVVLISSKSSRTSKAAAKNALPHTGTMRRKIYDLIANDGGHTDFELEERLKGKHQSVSAGRRSLVIDGFIEDSGRTRKNEIENDCIVWCCVWSESLFG